MVRPSFTADKDSTPRTSGRGGEKGILRMFHDLSFIKSTYPFQKQILNIAVWILTSTKLIVLSIQFTFPIHICEVEMLIVGAFA
jgi:hypothetical protein